jgi:CelD/BcsL family acetyltransferase involved in cellulose biosynthesis
MSYAADILGSIADLNSACDDIRVERCEVVTDFHRLEELWPEWERLWESDPRAEVFQTPEWTKAWWRAFGHRYSLCSVVVFSGNEVTGIVPLVRRGNFLQFLGTPQADYADVICEEHRAAEVLAVALKTLLTSVQGWKESAFQHLSKHSRLVRYYDQLPRDIRSRLQCVPAERQQTIILRNQREEIFKALLGKHHSRRLQNRLRKAGQLRFRHLETLEEIQQYLPDFFRHHVRRHAAVGRRSLCANPEFCQFLRALIQELGPTGRVRFGILELNGRPLAWDLGFQVNGKFLLYQHTFDLDAWHYTPGEVLLWKALEYARDHVTREFDFGKGDELYKDRFANYSRETFSLFVQPPGLAGWIRGLGRAVQGHVQPSLWKIKEIAKSQRTTLRPFRSIRMWMIGMWGCVRQARKNGALLQYGLQLPKKMFGNSIWSKRSTDVFASETSRTGTGGSDQSVRDRNLEVKVSNLGDLVDLAWEHPEILSLTELPQCRKRLKRGERAYIAWEGSRAVIVCWAASNTTIATDPDAPRLGISASTPAIVIDESWSARDHDISASYRLLLSVVSEEAANRGADLLVHCSSDQPLLRKELESQGFRPKFQTTRYKILSHYHRNSVSQYPKNSLRSSQLA